MNARLPRLVFAVVLISCAALYMVSVPSMPEVIATLFVGDGSAKSYMTRSFYLPYILVFGLGLSALLAFMLSVLPRIVHQRRVERMSEDEQSNLEAAVQIVGPFGWWYASFTVLFAALVHGWVVKANHVDPPQLANAPFLILLGVFLPSRLRGWRS